METRCPYSKCEEQFKVECGQRIAQCPKCSRHISVKPLEVWQQLDRLAAKYAQRGDASFVGSDSAPQFSAVLEDIRSLFNIGSMFRTADGAGFAHIYLTGISGIPPRKEIAKVSLGAEDSVKWKYSKITPDLLEDLRSQGIQIVGLEYTKDIPHSANSVALADAIKKRLLRKPLCLAVGNEVTGLSAETLSACDLICHLPMRGMKESLNVAVAFGIAAYRIAEHFDQ